MNLLEVEELDERSSSRSLVRLLAVAATVLLISFLLVNRSTDALSGRAGAGAHFRAGNVSLIDDDSDRSLFDVPVMAPGQQYENCIAVSYTGALDQPAVELTGRGGTGLLASALQLTVAVGRDGRFGDCAEFVPDAVL